MIEKFKITNTNLCFGNKHAYSIYFALICTSPNVTVRKTTILEASNKCSRKRPCGVVKYARHQDTLNSAIWGKLKNNTAIHIYIEIALSNESDWVDESGLAPLDSLSCIDWLLLVCLLFVFFFARLFFGIKILKFVPSFCVLGFSEKKSYIWS